MNKHIWALVALRSFILAGVLLLIPLTLEAQTPIKYGDCLQGSIGLPAQINTYTFSGSKNDVITVRSGRSSGSLWPQIEVYAPNGSLLKRTSNTPSARIDTLSLPNNGSYSILVADGFNGTLTGGYGLCLQRTFDPGQATPITYGTTVLDTINFVGYINTYTFPGNKNEVITIQMARSTGSLWPQIEVYAPKGSLLKRTSNTPSARIDTLRLPSDGSYTILATDGFNGTLSGTYSLNLTRIRTTVEEQPDLVLPVVFELKQNYPNPFNFVTTIDYQLPRVAHVKLSVYDILGKEIAVLVNEEKQAGIHQANFGAINIANGIYFYRLQTVGFVETKKLRILR